jgi:glutamate formiminotransferase/formiminotetrahydrofolate cyclodeaminase
MSNPLVECIPNFSEARRPEVIEKIISSIKSVTDVYLLDQHSDLDHNRTVLTFVGKPDAVEEAAYRSIEMAAQLIDMDQHLGEHPRIGATDVVPFVPISDVSMQDCVALARRLGKRVADDLNIPVFLYEEAASIPEKQNLENIRSGQYEGLKTEIGSRPVKTPDFGPATLGKAGATVIGARHPLIAFNVYLTTNDVTIAQKIGRAVRHSSGGLRFVKGMGVLVDGKAQVSMNLTNYKKTSIARVVEFIRREAERYGTSILSSELVGLIPQDALVESAQWYLQLDGFQKDQILEQRIFQIPKNNDEPLPDQSTDFLNRLAAGTATPGGGAAAAFTTAEGAALVSMVSQLTIGKKKYVDVTETMQNILEKAESLRSRLLEAVDEDANAFNKVMDAFRLPKSTEEEIQTRDNAIQKAYMVAADVPMKICYWAHEVMKLALKSAEIGNINTMSDAASGFLFAKAGFLSASLNVRTNTIAIHDTAFNQDLLEQLRILEEQGNVLEKELWVLLKERGGFPIF